MWFFASCSWVVLAFPNSKAIKSMLLNKKNPLPQAATVAVHSTDSYIAQVWQKFHYVAMKKHNWKRFDLPKLDD